MTKPISLAEKRKELLERQQYNMLADKLEDLVGRSALEMMCSPRFDQLVLTVQDWINKAKEEK